jgi:hypothetical protein
MSLLYVNYKKKFTNQFIRNFCPLWFWSEVHQVMRFRFPSSINVQNSSIIMLQNGSGRCRKDNNFLDKMHKKLEI